MLRRPPRSTRSATRFPYPTLFRANDLLAALGLGGLPEDQPVGLGQNVGRLVGGAADHHAVHLPQMRRRRLERLHAAVEDDLERREIALRSEEHTSELQSLMRISYAVVCLQETKSNRNPDKRE